MSDLTVAYITSRREPRIGWFFRSLARQAITQPNVIVIDRHCPAEDAGTPSPFPKPSSWHPPKPNVWSGPHRLTKEDYFSASNARNTAACLCNTPWIAFVDDLSVLAPTWLASVYEAMAGNYIALGAYQKVRKLIVVDGLVQSFEEYAGGIDNRLAQVTQDVTPCDGKWLYGCSLAMPLEAILSINGWPENLTDGMAYEDVLTGVVLENAGWKFKFDRRMKTFESEEDHHTEPPMKRSDPGRSPLDKSHAALNIALASKRFENSFDIRELRDRTLAGEPWPIPTAPDVEWFTGTPLKDL